METLSSSTKIRKADSDNILPSIHTWLSDNRIRNEKGDRIEFENHLFLYDIYCDQSQFLTIMKAAQVGLSTLAILKNHHDAKNYKMDIIYTLPTDNDVRVFVGGKVNRIIQNNPPMLKDVADKDSIESKRVGNSMIYFRGTWTKKAAIMVTADRLVHDEKDSSKLDVIADYQARLQHSKFRQIHTFSHPSLPQTGVHVDWEKSDQKHWFIKCPHCNEWQFLEWSLENPKRMSVDLERKIFICKKCTRELSDNTRRLGQWVPKERGKSLSGYWVPMLIAPWVSAKTIVDKFQSPETTPEFFYTKILGLPFADGSAKLLEKHFIQNLTGQAWAPGKNERVVIGIDTGLRLDYVIGNKHGLFFHDDADSYSPLNDLMTRWDKAIAIIDSGGDLIGSRAFAERFPGRVYLCMLGGDHKTKELVRYGTGDEQGNIIAERNRMIQLVIDEFRNKRIPVHGRIEDWYEYWRDWNNLSKMKVLDPDTGAVKSYKWIRAGRDHRALATVFWRVGMMRFAGMGAIEAPPPESPRPRSYMIDPGEKPTASFNPEELFDFMEQQNDDDWRNR